jgi:hypothetical protein
MLGYAWTIRFFQGFAMRKTLPFALLAALFVIATPQVHADGDTKTPAARCRCAMKRAT